MNLFERNVGSGSTREKDLPTFIKLTNFSRLLSFVTVFCFVSFAFAQEREITGVIVDNMDMPLPGVNVTIKGTTTGTQTDFDGLFSINAENGDVLEISFIGFKNQEITVTANTNEISIALEEDIGMLSEVVVTGYGRQTRNRLTTSIARMDDQVLQTSTRANAATALQGEVPGLKITNTTGQPGATPQIQLRGGTDFGGGGTPLILIDGVPGTFFAMNSDDIESIDVLKDAAATAIYGARAANGVILVTTKQGKRGKSNIVYKQKYSFNYKRTAGKYLSAGDYIQYNRQAVKYYEETTGLTNFDSFLTGNLGFGTSGNTTNSPFSTQYLTDSNRYLLDHEGWETVTDPIDPSREILFRETDVGAEIYQSSMAIDHYIAFQGGNEKGNYYASLGYLDDDGLIRGSNFERFSGKFTGAYNIYDNLKVNSSIMYAHSKYNQSPLGDDYTVFHRFQGYPPTARVYNNNPDGTLSDDLNPGTNFGFGNPLYYMDKFVRDNLEQRITANVGLEWKIIPDLTLTLNGSHFAVNNMYENFDRAFINGGVFNDTRAASASIQKVLTNQLNATLSYTHDWDLHHMDVLVGTEYYRNKQFSFSAGTKDSPTDLIHTLNAGAEANGVPSSSWTEHVISSAFGRLNYDFDTRFLLGFTFRYDGSSRLGDNKFGFFPGVSAGWNAHQEEFFQNSGVSSIVSKLKPRISYGVNGNVDVLGNYTVFGAYGSQGIYDGQTGYANTSLPNLGLKWEKSKTLNFGLDFSLFDDRVNFMADYFIRDVEDKLAALILPQWTGFSSITTNNGTLRNKGFELEVRGAIVRTEDFNWSINANLATIKNYAHKLPENDNELNRQGGSQIYNPKTGQVEWVGGLQQGQRVGTDLIVTYVQDHVYRDQAEVDADVHIQDDLLRDPHLRFPGDVKWEDTNGDDIINSLDRQVIGRTTPNLYGGISTTLNYKNVALYVKTDYTVGHMAYNHILGKGLAQTQGNQNTDVMILNSWRPDNMDTDIPRFVFTDPQGNYFRGNESTVNSKFWEKADYLALREVTLSYTMPSSWFNNVIENAMVYVTGSNLYYWTKYSGTTPEQGGYQNGQFPVPKTLTLGLNVTF